MNLSFKCLCGKAYLNFLDLLDHHFYEHEESLPEREIVRGESLQTTIGYSNTKTWTDVYGETHHAE